MQLITKKVFGHLVEHLMCDRWRNGIMVGINPLRDFGKIHDRLSRKKRRWAGDFKWWDGGMLSQIQHLLAEEIPGRCVGEEDRIVAEFILANLAHCVVIVGDDTWLTTHSFPSGSFLTAILNSLVNRLYTAAWYNNECRLQQRKPSLVEFTRDICDHVYGDDKVIGSDLDGFDMLSMARFFEELGIGFTTAKKEKPSVGSEEWEDITFLKRSFQYDARFKKIVPPLDRDTLFSSMSWYSGDKDHDVVVANKLDAFQREAFLHPDYHSLMARVKSGIVGLFDHEFRSEHELCSLVQLEDPEFCSGFVERYA
jgi:hypothetical protein